MRINDASFIISAVSSKQWPADALPEIVFSGKSNVGKSSLINALCNRKNLAYSGNTPGKTRQINFYNIDGIMRFVDLPGYGYTKASKETAKSYSGLAQQYLSARENIRLVVQILDIRHDPTEDDLQMIDFLNHSKLPYLISLGKADKLSKSKAINNARRIASLLPIDPDTPFIITSSQNRRGMHEIWDAIQFYYKDED